MRNFNQENKEKEKEIERLFNLFYKKEEIKNIEFAEDLYRSLANNMWSRKTEKGIIYLSLTRKEAGSLVSKMRNQAGCPHETLDEYICLDSAGKASKNIIRLMNMQGGYELREQDLLIEK